jgi:serine/threonine protein kinase
MGILAQHIQARPLDPRQAAPDRVLPPGVCQLTMRLLAKDPADRPSCAEAVERLQPLVAELPRKMTLSRRGSFGQ